MTVNNNSSWYRNQCSLYSVRLDEWLESHKGRDTKARKEITTAAELLGRRQKDEVEAHETLCDIEEMLYSCSNKSKRVIAKAIGRMPNEI